jgi:membrane-bound lytic murein transglycosylase A
MEFSRRYTCLWAFISKPSHFLILALLVLGACTRAPLKDRASAMRLASHPFIADDLGAQNFVQSLEAQVTFLESARVGETFSFGPVTVPTKAYIKELRGLLDWSKTQAGLVDSIWDKLAAEYSFLEVYGSQSWGRILLTSYFEPEIEGSLARTDTFSQPLYKAPADIIDVATSAYDERFSDIGSMKGRMAMDEKLGKLRLFPYHTRKQIDGPDAVLKSKRLELCYTHPVDAFFMQVQGSGTILLPNQQRLRLGYADQNGHKYHSIGKFLTDIIPLKEMSLFRIERYLHTLPPDEAQSVLFKNPSYVFFRPLDGPAVTSLGNAVFAGRTIATDGRYFPKGALAFLQFRRPVFASDIGDEVSDWQPVSRFVFDQDTGGAIRGGGRADLFWGTGDVAKRFAGVIKDDHARLYYLVPKALLASAQGIGE